jgi:hypothetical protein
LLVQTLKQALAMVAITTPSHVIVVNWAAMM